MKYDKNLIQYKYTKGIASIYQSQFRKERRSSQRNGPIDDNSFNYDKIRETMKVKYSPPRNFTTINMSTYQPYKVENNRPKAGDRESNKKMDLVEPAATYADDNKNLSCFVGDSTYNYHYPNWGSGPAKGSKQKKQYEKN